MSPRHRLVRTHVPIVQRAGPQAVAQERDQRRQLHMFAQVVADNLTGAAPVSQIMADAARTERDIRKILQRMDGHRLDHMTTATQQIAAHGPFRDGIDFASARDVIWTLTSPEVFLLLTAPARLVERKLRHLAGGHADEGPAAMRGNLNLEH